MKGPISLPIAALAGFIYAVIMSAWVYFDRGLGFDELSIRFAAYFTVFTLGFYVLYNLAIKYLGKGGE